jgi:carboxypeptidase T
MKKTALVFALVLATCTSILAQTGNYKRLRIYTNDAGLVKLTTLGIETDHGDYRKNVWFVSDFSQAEIAKIQNAGFRYEVLIDDVKHHYAHQSPGVSAHRSAAAGTCVSGIPVYQTPSNFSLGSMGGYFTYQEMIANLDSMASKYPNLITVKQAIPFGTTVEGQPVYYVKISDNANVDETEPEVLYSAVHHAREPGGMSQLIFYMWYLLENYNSDAKISGLVNGTEMFFITCLNPDGYQYNELNDPAGGGMWRKNRRDNLDGTFGIDLNRNYGYNWGFDDDGSSPFTGDETYRGTVPFSEPETQLMRDFVNSRSFRIALNYHTFGNLLIYPWGYDYSIYTPDSALFANYGNLLTTYNGYTYGTADQTVGYIVNGSSDDWMYGEQSAKPKIFAMTPECGDAAFGFWPPANEIIPLCENTIFQNITMAQLAGPYAQLTETSPSLINSGGGYVQLNLKQLGLDTLATYTISLTPVTSNIVATGAPLSISGLGLLQEINDSISFALTTPMNNGDVIKFLLNIDNGQYTLTDTIVKYFGSPVTVFASDANTTSGWNAGQWGTSTSIFYSPSASITDSPIGDYNGNENKSVRVTTPIDLSNALNATLSFYARWALEPNYDFVQVEASTNGGGSWTPLCGTYTVPGSAFQELDEPLYEGFQLSWVKEEIDLADYLGSNILIRFQLVSDGFQEYDGFYFDDVLVTKVLPGTNSVEENLQSQATISIQPNPASTYTFVNLNPRNTNSTLVVYDAIGREVVKTKIASGTASFRLETSNLSPGIYVIRIADETGLGSPVKMIIQ